MNKKLAIYASSALLMTSLSSCLEFDTPSDEFSANQQVVSGTVYSGDADKLDYEYQPTEEEVDEAINTFYAENYFGNIMTAEYIMLGGKDGVPPAEHAYQYHYSLCTDNYAGYTTVINSSFMGGFTLETTYSYNRTPNEGPYGRLLGLKNELANPLNIDCVNNIVEIKAICLLLFNYVAQECTDLYGAIPYVDHKANKEVNPFTFNKGIDVYASIVQNLDDINACLKNFENRPDWYKQKINELLWFFDVYTQDASLDTWRRFANSLKLRMAMHVVKVQPEEAQKWAEEAIAEGIVEHEYQEIGLNRACLIPSWIAHPLKVIMNGWNDIRVNASFISMLTSLDHPYMQYFFSKNSHDITNQITGENMPPETAIVGVRAGLRMEGSQQYFSNMRVAYSQFTGTNFDFMPLYAIKLAEMDFLRAEGALRGWNMGGSAEDFYVQGIRHADCGEKIFKEEPYYDELVEDYLKVASAVPYTYVDPMDDANNIESVTKIGVAWNGGDDMETKLEKIITQKYIALFPYSYEAWTEMRRTGYPKIFPVLNPTLANDGSLSEGDLIRRMPLPNGDTNAGLEDIQTSGLEALGGSDLMSTRVFWDLEGVNNF